MFEHDKELHVLREILEEIKEFRVEIKKLFPSKMEIVFIKGDKMSAAAVTLNLEPTPQTTNATVVETVNGQPYTPVPGDLTWSVQDATIASMVQNPDGSATFTAVAVGVTMCGCVDKTTGNSGTGTITVALGTVPGTLVISFSPANPSAQLQAKKV